ncbi:MULTISPECIES: alpha/beta hydrolase [Methanobacterium]|jgi:predicted alpha/beta hydrolase|uniref:Alpha/beta fold hydrolase n=1 Tax=Methanobacterium veterum TaxID=408577 RepID=A0A9E5DH19_9EURY|nr:MULTISPECIES: alpha/beta fold hydrolase [Methanobacterium]MCZ3365201.1 alpha/beta fold hydrolase [Methanobacterium veterum]MCZ3372956.1 alpha/beta fold hydrolase [Methanobacterium veterum]
MEIEREIINGNGLKVPCVTFKPPNPIGAVVAVHGYGGLKEEMMGVAWHMAEKGFVVGAIDLRGHGEHLLDLDRDILLDIETAISHFRPFGKVTAVGHSLGGRLSLISSADYAIGISPALNRTFSPQTKELLEERRDYRVRRSKCTVFNILNDLPQFQPDESRSLIIYGSRDVLEIMSECAKLKSGDTQVIQIDKTLHNDIFLFGQTFETITQKLHEWYV